MRCPSTARSSSTWCVASLFHGGMTQQQVDGMNAILAAWEDNPAPTTFASLSYPLATTAHETGFTMQPIKEYGEGEGMEYGKEDPETKQVYFGRGYVQLTWKDNYVRADEELGFGHTKDDETSCEWYPDNQLKAGVAAETMFQGMGGLVQGRLEGPSDVGALLQPETPTTARPRARSSTATSTLCRPGQAACRFGNLIKGYHIDFLAALEASEMAGPQPEPGDEVVTEVAMRIKLAITAAGQAHVEVVEAELG